MYKIMKLYCGQKLKRYNTKTFESCQEAKKYVRRLVTQLYGKYYDDYSQFGFKVVRLDKGS